MLHDKWDANFDSFISNKIIAVAGDVSLEKLGIENDYLRKMLEEIEIVVNFAAITEFDER